MLVVIDPGHGGRDSGATGSRSFEKDINLIVSRNIARILNGTPGVTCVLTREIDEDLAHGYPVYTLQRNVPQDEISAEKADLQARCDVANSRKADVFLSVHCNAGEPEAHGTETWCFPSSAEGQRLAQAVQLGALSLGTYNRGVKEKAYYVLHNTDMPAALVELAFISNPDEETKLLDSGLQDRVAEAIAHGILSYLAVRPTEPSVDSGGATVLPPSQTSLLGPPVASLGQARQWAINHNASAGFVDRADLYYRLAPEHGGVRPDAAYADSAKETAFGHYTGVVPEGYMNPGGIKTSGFDAMQHTMLQLNVSDSQRGRAMGIWMLSIGFGPVGQAMLGGITEALGSSFALAMCGVAMILTFVGMSILMPRLRQA